MFQLSTYNQPKQFTCLEVGDSLYLVNHLIGRTVSLGWFSFSFEKHFDFEDYLKSKTPQQLYDECDNCGSLTIFGNSKRTIFTQGSLPSTHVFVMFDKD